MQLMGALPNTQQMCLSYPLTSYVAMYPFTETSISTMAVTLVEKYCLSHKLALPDTLIAATAIYHNIELYTLNVKDFKFLDKVKLYGV